MEGIPLTALVVDDERGTTRILVQWLQSQGWEAEGFTDARDALQRHAEKGHALVVADWSMPDLDGLELCRRLRSAKQAQRTYLILVTASEDATLLERAFEEGVDDFLRKPVSKPEFLARLKAARRVCRLELEVRERSEQEMERNLHKAALKRISAVAGALAHEMRTPLGALRIQVERLEMKRGKLPDDVGRIAEKMGGLVRHMAETLEDVLATFGASNPHQNWGQIDLWQECQAGVDMVRDRLQPGVKLECKSEEDPLPAYADGPGVRRLVANLVGNAMRHTKTGEVVLGLRRTPAGLAEILVQDTGAGIPPELLPWLGEPLLLNSENTSMGRYVAGNGMGLSLCRKVVERHGGVMTVDSETGKGTCVRAEIRIDLGAPADANSTGSFFVRSIQPDHTSLKIEAHSASEEPWI